MQKSPYFLYNSKMKKYYLKNKSIFFIILFSLLLNSCVSQKAQENETDLNDDQETQSIVNQIDSTPEAQDTEEPEKVPQSEIPVGINLDKIILYHIGDFTSRFAPYSAPAIRGVEDWAALINAEGGILDKELVLIFSDTGGDIDLAFTAFEKILDEDENPLAVIVYQTEVAEAIIQLATRHQVPVINLGIIPAQQDFGEESYLFNFYVPYEQQFKYFLDYLVINWDEINPVTLDTGIRLGFFAWDDTFGRSALTDENRAYMTSLAIELVAEEYFFSSSVENISNPLVRAWDKGANVIYTNTYLHGPAIILNDLNRLALRNFFIVGGPSPAMDISSYGFLEYNTYLDGFISPFISAWYTDEDNPSIDLVNQSYQSSNRPITDMSQRRIIAQGALDMLLKTIEQVILEEGDEKLSGKTLYKALANLEDYQVLGGLFKVNFAEGQRTLDDLHMRQVKDFMDFVIID